MNQRKPKGLWAPGQWLPENSAEDGEIALMAKKGAVTAFNIVEHEANTFYVTLHFNWRPELIHLSTRRVKDEPRMFKNMDRLIAHIKEKYPQIRDINLTLNRRRPRNHKIDDFEGTQKRAEDRARTPVAKKTA